MVSSIIGIIRAARLETIPLSLAAVATGGALAKFHGSFQRAIMLELVVLIAMTHILANIASDCGHNIYGADLVKERVGPRGQTAQGKLSLKVGLVTIIVLSSFMVAFGVFILVTMDLFRTSVIRSLFFVTIGGLSLLAAVGYSISPMDLEGKIKPYGYKFGLGDIAVFLLFGPIPVVFGSSFQTNQLFWLDFLPAFAMGWFALGVLNINNIRDRFSDPHAGKETLPSRLGKKKALYYQVFIILISFVEVSCFNCFNHCFYPSAWLFLCTLPLFLYNTYRLVYAEGVALTKYLKQFILLVVLFSYLFISGLLVA